MKTRSWVLGSILAGLAMSASAQPAPATTKPGSSTGKMQELSSGLAGRAKTPEERQAAGRTLAEHYTSTMGAIGLPDAAGCRHGQTGRQADAGAMGGGAWWRHRPKYSTCASSTWSRMLEQMRSHRDMLDKR